MKNKILVGLIGLFLLNLVSADLTIMPSSINIQQQTNTTKIYNFTITNTDLNNSENLNIQLTGGEILDLTNDFPKTTSIAKNSTITLYYSLNTNGKNIKNLSGLFTFYYSSQKNIPIAVEILVPSQQPPQLENKTLKFTLQNPPLEPGKRVIFIVTDENNYPISEGTLILIMDTIKEASISDGYSIFTIPEDAICPAVVKVSSPGYQMLTKLYPTADECSSGEPQQTIGKLKFTPSGISVSVQQFITTQVGYWIKNLNSNCNIQITGGDFTSGTIITTEGRKPVRVENLPYEEIMSGKKILATFTIDTTGFDTDGTPLVNVGTYQPVYTVYAEDCKGNDLTAIFQFNLNVIKGIYPNQTEQSTTPHIYLSAEYEASLGNTATIIAKGDNGNPLEDAELKIYFPNGDKRTFWTSSEGKFDFILTQLGNYFVRASKDGYQNTELNFSIGTKKLSIKTTSPYLLDTLEITTKSDNLTVSGVEVKITAPSGISKTFTTSSDGKVTYIVNETGNYEIFVNKVGYSSETKTISVSARELSLTTNDVILGGTLIITVKSGENLIKGAIVTITDPNGTKKNYTTDSAGEITLTLTQAGSYSLIVTKGGYSSATKNLNLQAKILTLTYDGDKIIGNNLLITTKSGDTIVRGVEIEITYPDNKIETLTTSSTGKLSLVLDQTGKYSLTATKQGYSDKTDTFEVTKKKLSLSITYYDSTGGVINKATYGGSMKIKVADNNGEVISGVTLSTQLPGGTSSGTSSIIFSSYGNYIVKATKTGYEDSSETITVTEPIRCSVDIKQKYINEPFMITCSPPKVTTLSIICNSLSNQITTNANGIANYTLPASGECYLSFNGQTSKTFQVLNKSASPIWNYLLYTIIFIVIVGIVIFLKPLKLKPPQFLKKKPLPGGYEADVTSDIEKRT